MLDYKVSTFNNGLRLVSAPLANTRAVTVMFLVGVGSRFETKPHNGMCHFLEHMFFKGTKKRPSTLLISKELDAVGASYNAFTAEEYTGFYIRVESGHFKLAMDILTDILYNSKFEPAEIEKEKGVIAEEINMYQDTPQSYISELAKKLFYGDSPLGRQIAGEKDTIKKFIRDDFFTYRDKFYTPDNMIVVVAGGTNSQDWKAEVNKYFDKIDLKKQGQFESIKETQEKPEVLTYYKKTDQAHLALGFRSIKRTDKRRPVLKVLNNLLGETMSSRLFTEIREKRGLAYYILSDIADFIDTGAFGVYAGVDLSRTDEAIKVILNEFNRLKKEKVSEEELVRAKDNLKGRLYLGLEESFSVADYLAEQELFWPQIDDPDTLVAKYQKVIAEDILKFANDFFTPQNLNLAIIGPDKNQENYRKILSQYN